MYWAVGLSLLPAVRISAAGLDRRTVKLFRLSGPTICGSCKIIVLYNRTLLRTTHVHYHVSYYFPLKIELLHYK
jgi:hypothetical protein